MTDINQPQRVSLDEYDFQTLVRGGIVRKDGAEILLRDIGYPLMHQILIKEMERFAGDE